MKSAELQTQKTSRPGAAHWLKSTAAALGVAALAGVAIGAPLSVPSQASAEVVPLARGEVMNQRLMAQATAEVEFTLPAVDVEKIPEATSSAASSDKPGAVSIGAPAAAAPDPGSAQAIAQKYVGSGQEFNCLVALWNRESGWNVSALNASSGAYGIPQALPGSKMASAGADWQTNPDTQIRWGLGYIKGRYGSPCGAWAHSQANGWY